MQNLYQLLGVKETATKKEIKKAWHALSLAYHPDRNNNSHESTEKTKEINNAHEILSDENTRKLYDFELAEHRKKIFEEQSRAEQNAYSFNYSQAYLTNPYIKRNGDTNWGLLFTDIFKVLVKFNSQNKKRFKSR